MQVQQYVMAYLVDQDRLRAILPEGFVSLRPVLRINAEIRGGETGYVELNTAVQRGETRGWLNIAHWEGVPFTFDGKTAVFETDFLRISFQAVGVAGGCPAEKDNDGCFFPGGAPELRAPERITENKEFCDCAFAWRFAEGDAHGVSIGKTLPAVPTPHETDYPHQDCTAENAAAIACEQVLGTYTVRFER